MDGRNIEKNDYLTLHGKKMTRNSTSDSVGFPSISATSGPHDKTKRRILVQRNHHFGHRQNVPPPGHEYDFRRTPDPGRATPRKCINGQIRPCIPPDTIDMDNINTVDAPTHLRKFREKLNVVCCPTPMPSESDIMPAPLPTARSAWDNNGNTTSRTTGAIANDLEDVIDCEMDQLEIRTSHLSKNNKPFHDKMGRRFKPSTAPIKYDVIVSDIDQENTILSPTPISPLNLTEHVIHHYFQKPVNKDRRIAKWLVECEEKKQNQLPAHLPDISASNRNVTVTFEEL